MLSVIIPFGGKKGSQQIEDIVKQSLEGIEGEVIFAEDWESGKAIAKGEFISFIIPDSLPAPGYFADLTSVFTDQAAFRKLALVAAIPEGVPALSSEPYPVRIAPLPGAVVRKSAFKDCKVVLTGDPQIDSHNLSVDFWNRGLRCYLQPSVKFGAEAPQLHLAELVVPDPKVLTLWKREMI